jgi:hypothetical protein
MSCSGSHLGIPINIKSTKFVKDLPMIDAEFRLEDNFLTGRAISMTLCMKITVVLVLR